MIPQGECSWCNGLGSIAVELGSSPRYRCPDCRGTGRTLPPADATDELSPDPTDDDAPDDDEGATNE